jgi:hypothetical protein
MVILNNNNRLFPSGTHVELAGMPAAMLNGMRGAVDAARDGTIVYSGVGMLAVIAA